MVKKKVLLYFPKVHSDTRPCKITPLPLLAISGLLDKENYEVKIFSDILQENYLKEIVENIDDSICVGFTCMTGFQIHDALRTAKIIRDHNPTIPLVWGGWHPSILPLETLENEFVDIVVIGQGERKFYEVVTKLENKDGLGEIKGICYKDIAGKLIKNLEPDEALEDLDNFPSYPYHLIDVEKCLGRTEYGNRTLHYISSYGCPHRCGFCIEPIVNKRRWKGLSAARVVSDWKFLCEKYKVDSISVYDSNFFVDKQRVRAICEGLLKENVKIKWGNVDGRVSQLVNYEQELWELMEKSGCSMILTGAESGTQEVLDLIQKDLKVEQIENFTRLCNDHNIRIFFSYLVGLPLFKDMRKNYKFVEKELKNTLKQIDSIMKINPQNRFSISIYTPYPGSQLYNRALEFGLKFPKKLGEWSEFMIAVPEDAFEQDNRRNWISKMQGIKIAMITQYIFGLKDIKARDYTAKKIKSVFLRTVFVRCWNIGLLIVNIRWRLKWFSLPVDFWIYTQVRKYSKLV